MYNYHINYMFDEMFDDLKEIKRTSFLVDYNLKNINTKKY